MWFPLALTAGFALAFLPLYLAERRNIEREAVEREEGARREGIGQTRGLADVTPADGGVPQPAPLRSRLASMEEGGIHVAAVSVRGGAGGVADEGRGAPA
jgi:hypothetical protein